MSIKRIFPKQVAAHIYKIAGGIIILLAAVMRIVLVTLGWTGTNGDEAMMDLAAMHIMEKGEHPIFFYGQNYLGIFEAYVGSVIFRIFGPSVLVMRFEMIAFTTIFLICLYILTSKIFTKTFALVILVLFLFGSPGTMAQQTRATGYPDVPMFVALIFLTAYILASSQHLLSLRKRMLLYFLCGLLVSLPLCIYLLFF